MTLTKCQEISKMSDDEIELFIDSFDSTQCWQIVMESFGKDKIRSKVRLMFFPIFPHF